MGFPLFLGSAFPALGRGAGQRGSGSCAGVGGRLGSGRAESVSGETERGEKVFDTEHFPALRESIINKSVCYERLPRLDQSAAVAVHARLRRARYVRSDQPRRPLTHQLRPLRQVPWRGRSWRAIYYLRAHGRLLRFRLLLGVPEPRGRVRLLEERGD